LNTTKDRGFFNNEIIDLSNPEINDNDKLWYKELFYNNSIEQETNKKLINFWNESLKEAQEVIDVEFWSILRDLVDEDNKVAVPLSLTINNLNRAFSTQDLGFIIQTIGWYNSLSLEYKFENINSLIKTEMSDDYISTIKSVSKFFIKEIHQVTLKILSGIMTDLLREYPNN